MVVRTSVKDNCRRFCGMSMSTVKVANARLQINSCQQKVVSRIKGFISFYTFYKLIMHHHIIWSYHLFSMLLLRKWNGPWFKMGINIKYGLILVYAWFWKGQLWIAWNWRDNGYRAIPTHVSLSYNATLFIYMIYAHHNYMGILIFNMKPDLLLPR